MEKEMPHYKKGLITGAYDMLHIGHLNSLKLASSMCDKLIVAVSTDEVIQDYKHKSPVIPFEHRLAMVKGLECVHMAIPQEDLYNKHDLCKELGVDVLFTCEEYSKDSYPPDYKFSEKELAGIERWEQFSKDANENGIDVVFLPRTKGLSSTDIKQHVIEQFSHTNDSNPELDEQDESEAQDPDDSCQ